MRRQLYLKTDKITVKEYYDKFVLGKVNEANLYNMRKVKLEAINAGDFFVRKKEELEQESHYRELKNQLNKKNKSLFSSINIFSSSPSNDGLINKKDIDEVNWSKVFGLLKNRDKTLIKEYTEF